MYDYSDKIVTFLIKQFIELFDRLRTTLYIDEINILGNVNQVYAELDELAQEWFLNIAKKAYKDAGGEDNSSVNRQWLTENILEAYDPVTKYVYINEVDRKRSRLAESLIASDDKNGEIDRALKLWSAMISQYAITSVDAAAVSAYKSLGVKEVVWKCRLDSRTCGICLSYNGNIYPIDKVPPKPHIGCRCYLVPKGREDNGK